MPNDSFDEERDVADAREGTTRCIDRRLVLPTSLKDKSIFEIWGRGGPARLLSRLADEHQLGDRAASPLTPDEIAELIELFKDEPLPEMLRNVVLRELRGVRRARPGPKSTLAWQKQLERDLLSSVYQRGLRVAVRYRRRRIRVEQNRLRREKRSPVPSHAAIAARYVRKWLPSMRMLSDKSIANMISELKDPHEKKPRKKLLPQ